MTEQDKITFEPPLLYVQHACLLHRNVRAKDSKEVANASERPERLHCINVGVATLFSRLEEKIPKSVQSPSPIRIVRSTATVKSIPDHVAARTILHFKTEEDQATPTYAETLRRLCKESRTKSNTPVQPGLEADLYRRLP